MNVIDSNILRSGMRAENRYTLFLIPLSSEHDHDIRIAIVLLMDARI